MPPPWTDARCVEHLELLRNYEEAIVDLIDDRRRLKGARQQAARDGIDTNIATLESIVDGAIRSIPCHSTAKRLVRYDPTLAQSGNTCTVVTPALLSACPKGWELRAARTENDRRKMRSVQHCDLNGTTLSWIEKRKGPFPTMRAAITAVKGCLRARLADDCELEARFREQRDRIAALAADGDERARRMMASVDRYLQTTDALEQARAGDGAARAGSAAQAGARFVRTQRSRIMGDMLSLWLEFAGGKASSSTIARKGASKAAAAAAVVAARPGKRPRAAGKASPGAPVESTSRAAAAGARGRGLPVASRPSQFLTLPQAAAAPSDGFVMAFRLRVCFPLLHASNRANMRAALAAAHGWRSAVLRRLGAE